MKSLWHREDDPLKSNIHYTSGKGPFCSERKTDICQTPIELDIEFVTEIYNQGYSFQTLNFAGSALSALGNSQDSFLIGSHPLVVRYISGVLI